MAINKDRAFVYILPTSTMVRHLRMIIEHTANTDPDFAGYLRLRGRELTEALYETVFVVTHNHLRSHTQDPEVPLLSEEDAVRVWCPAYYSNLRVADVNSATGTSEDLLSEFIYEKFIDEIICTLSYSFSFLPMLNSYSLFELQEIEDGIAIYYGGDWRAREWSTANGLPYEFCAPSLP